VANVGPFGGQDLDFLAAMGRENHEEFGAVRSLVRATVYRASLSWWSPERLSRTRMVWPLERGWGGAN
jgi:hypothetical protein